MNMQAVVFANTRTGVLSVKQRDMLVNACRNFGVLSPYAHSRTRFALLRDGYVVTAGDELKVTEKGLKAVQQFLGWPRDVVVDNPRVLPNSRTGIPC